MSQWINEANGEFAPHEGYGPFSVSRTADVLRHIQNQRTHHENRSAEEEFLEFLEKYGGSYEPAYLLDPCVSSLWDSFRGLTDLPQR